MASASGIVLSIIISLIILGILIWLYVEQAMFLFKGQNFTQSGWNNWRRILLIVFVILGLIGAVLTALAFIFGASSSRNGRYSYYNKM